MLACGCLLMGTRRLLVGIVTGTLGFCFGPGCFGLIGTASLVILARRVFIILVVMSGQQVHLDVEGIELVQNFFCIRHAELLCGYDRILARRNGLFENRRAALLLRNARSPCRWAA